MSDAPIDLILTCFRDTWADAVERGCCFTLDRMVIEGARDERVQRLMVASPYRSAPIRLVRRLQGDVMPPLPAATGAARTVGPYRLRRSDPTTPRGLAATYRRYDRHLRDAAASMDMQRPVVVTVNPFVAAHCRMEWARSVTYFGYDEWSASPLVRPWRTALEDAYHRIAQRGHPVAAVSPLILEKIDPKGPSVVIPNGVEPSEWEAPWHEPTWCADVRAPMVLYVGNLGERIDVAALARTAARLPRASIVLVGPVVDPGSLDGLGELPNVRIEPRVGRAEVAGLIHRADVCVMPHRSTELTEAMSPLKLYEYLAAGRPTVATDLATVRAVDPRVLTAPVDDPDEFATKVEQALRFGPTPEAERKRFVIDNSWKARFDQLIELVSRSL